MGAGAALAEGSNETSDLHRYAAFPNETIPAPRDATLPGKRVTIPLPPMRPADLGRTPMARATASAVKRHPSSGRVAAATVDQVSSTVPSTDAATEMPVINVPSRLWRDRPRTVPAANIAVARRIWPAGVAVEACQSTELIPAAVEALIRKEAETAKLDARFATLIARDESQYGAVGISEKGALGVMQLMPGTAERYKVVNPCDPAENIRGGVAFLADLFREFGHPMLVAAAYNAGPGAVYEAKGVPRFPETIRYVASISNDYFGFSNRLAKRGRNGTGPTPQANIVAAADTTGAVTPTASKRPELNWIGGHVLNLD